jgi:ABC-type lipoprotein export system ATPase subunit
MSNISDGQKKIVELIRCLVERTGKIYIFDEPTANLDSINRRRVIELLCDLAKSKTVIILTHDNDFKNVSSKIINLNELKRGK